MRSDSTDAIGSVFDRSVGISAAGFVVGLGTTAVALSSGFIWAYQGRPILPFLAAFFAWIGYLLAHASVTGEIIDPPDVAADAGFDSLVPAERWRQVTLVLGLGTLVSGIVVGAVFVREENLLMTTVGGVLFLTGYVLAHYAETDQLL